MLRVLTASTDYQLTTTSAVALELWGSTSVSTSEYARIDRLITIASARAETIIGQARPEGGVPTLTAQVYQETVPAYGLRSLMLSRTPVRGIKRMFDSTATCEATEYDSTDYRIEDAEAGLVSFSDDSVPDWTAPYVQEAIETYPVPGSETRPWLVEYEAGYVVGGGKDSTGGGTTSTGVTLPADLEQAVVEMTLLRARRTQHITSKRVGEISISYRTEGEDDPATVLLAPYIRHA